METVTTWLGSFKFSSQKMNAFIAACGAIYMFLDQSLKDDLGPYVVGFLALCAAYNIFLRNKVQPALHEAPEAPVDEA